MVPVAMSMLLSMMLYTSKYLLSSVCAGIWCQSVFVNSDVSYVS